MYDEILFSKEKYDPNYKPPMDQITKDNLEAKKLGLSYGQYQAYKAKYGTVDELKAKRRFF